MGIREQIDDAVFLRDNRRPLGALTVLMLAVAASSKRRFRGEKGIGDREAFTKFLGGRMRSLLFGNVGGPDIGSSGIGVSFRGVQYDLVDILYKYYRCELVHEGGLPEDVAFVDSDLQRGATGITISVGEKIVLDHGLIDLLIRAVSEAECNAEIFGFKVFELQPCAGLDEEEFGRALIEEFEMSPGRLAIMKHAVKLIGPDEVHRADPSRLAELFRTHVLEGMPRNGLNGGAITGLSSAGLTDRTGSLLPKGAEVLRRITEKYDRVERSRTL